MKLFRGMLAALCVVGLVASGIAVAKEKKEKKATHVCMMKDGKVDEKITKKEECVKALGKWELKKEEKKAEVKPADAAKSIDAAKPVDAAKPAEAPAQPTTPPTGK